MSGDLKVAARQVLPGLVDKMRKEIRGDVRNKKERVHSFTKVSIGAAAVVE